MCEIKGGYGVSSRKEVLEASPEEASPSRPAFVPAQAHSPCPRCGSLLVVPRNVPRAAAALLLFRPTPACWPLCFVILRDDVFAFLPGSGSEQLSGRTRLQGDGLRAAQVSVPVSAKGRQGPACASV